MVNGSSSDATAACWGKQIYPTKDIAHRAVRRIQKQRHRFGKAKVYLCPYCGGVHISQTKRGGTKRGTY